MLLMFSFPCFLNVTDPLLHTPFTNTHCQLDDNNMGYLSMSPEDIDELETMDAWVAMMAGLEEEEEVESDRYSA
jgi:hypothetical protein